MTGATGEEGDMFAITAIDRVWASHFVRFALLKSDHQLFIGYYDANRQLTVACRPKRSSKWIFHKVDTWLGWDTHNSITLGLDKSGHLHVSGNMHADPLVYYKTSDPGDVRSLFRVKTLFDPRQEKRMTYPSFLRGRDDELIYHFRDGGSGSGNEIYLVYDEKSQTWRSLHDGPLLDGQKKHSAYFIGPTRGPDGWFHLVWVWRDTPDAGTNHDLSYARSPDLVSWERADGISLNLPITIETGDVVDAVPSGGGMLNGNTLINFDPEGHALIAYFKHDQGGNTQIHIARKIEDGWQIICVTNWRDFRWE